MTGEPIPLDVATKALELLAEADREIAALKAEIARPTRSQSKR